MTSNPMIRRHLEVRGVVQGVGFRPFVAQLADELNLVGWCRNDSTGVQLELQGPRAAVEQFESTLRQNPPPLAQIVTISSEVQKLLPEAGFSIEDSQAGDGGRTLIPPDTATCDDCLRELFDPSDRRHRHPFITCTNCGPRLTIIVDVPYDRPCTTMAEFPLCARCHDEYTAHDNRRYHAQPISCHECGPKLSYREDDSTLEREKALAATASALLAGKIIAIKGIGGYHLACDATNPDAVNRLRQRKHRPEQPFAVMVADLATARTLVAVPDEAAVVLTGPERPIVLLPARTELPGVAPGLDDLGVLLAYNPVQHLLFADLASRTGKPAALVMTSGNLSGEPLCYTESDAHARLAAIADGFLEHDRPIAVPCEDSVLSWADSGVLPVRRSRGFAPLPVALPDGRACVLAAGAEVKNTVALSRDGLAFVSAHIGDLGSLESRKAYRDSTNQLLTFHRQEPDVVVVDRHPGYASRAWGEQLATEFSVPLHEVQHHHAHLAALAAEHGRLHAPLLGVVYDGTGYGCDTTIWGGELLLLGDEGRSAERLGHLGLVRLPGGDAGVHNPVRTAALALTAAGVPLTGPVALALTDDERRVLPILLASRSLWVPTSSVGRLFDVVSSLLGIRHRVSYEAQAAIELELAATRWRRSHPSGQPLPLRLPVRRGVLEVEPLIRDLAAGLDAGHPVGQLAWSFHVKLAEATALLCLALATKTRLRTVGLTGGVFANRLLLAAIASRLEAIGLEVLTHRVVPAGDGGLSLGQLAVGNAELAWRARSGQASTGRN